MSDRTQSIVAIALSVVAVGVIGIGLAQGPAGEPTPADRVAALSEQIICPFCSGESLADSGSGVAADYRDLIEQRVSDGYTDEQILAEFADNFGDAYVVDTSEGIGSVLLWAIPILVLVGGGLVIVAMKRSTGDRAEVAS